MEESTLLSAVLKHRDALASAAEFLRILAGICWTLNYFSMLRTSQKDEIPSTGIFPLCNDIGWEFIYAFIYPKASAHWEGGVRVWFLVHCIVIFFIIKNAHNEWGLFPLVQRNLYFLYGIVTIGFAIGQYSFAREVGPDLGFFYGGVLCQTLASLGPIAQILSRNSTRGASLLTWLLRAVATFGGFIKLTIYYLTGNAAGPWFESPMCKFYIGLTLILDFIYPICYYVIRRQELVNAEGDKKKKTKSGKAA
ncbi:hypothetical protein N7497_001894 [Penicillium chrysogenum]|nr:hypothetical protein N7497_001894 [Penicillium chrysogenum]